MLEIFAYQFMVRAFIAGFFVSALLGLLGCFVVVRKMSFMGDGIAHSSLAGIALAILLGWAPLPTAIIFAIFVATIIYFLEKKTNLSTDMAIGIIFTTGMALGVILINFYDGYQPELLSYLFGNILMINNSDLYFIIGISSILISLVFFYYRQMMFSTFDHDGAYLSGINVDLFDLFFYIITAVSIIISIKLVGIVLVSALLVIPSSISLLFSKSFKSFCEFSVFIAVVIVFLGLTLSYYFDLPSGATIVLTGSGLFFISYVFKIFYFKNR